MKNIDLKMDIVLQHIENAIKSYGRDVIAEKRIVYLLADYGVLKELPAERRILLDIINDGYAEQLLDLQPERQDNSLKICAFIAEIHKKTGYQVQKLITVFKWLSDGLGIKTVPFETILQVEKEAPIREIIIKGKYKVKDPRSAYSSYTLPIDGLFRNLESNVDTQKNSSISQDEILKQAVAKATEQHIQYVLAQYKIDTTSIKFIETPSMFFAIISLASNIRMTKLIYLKDTIAESMAPNGCRLIVPIPGTNNIGIELLKEAPVPPSFSSVMQIKENHDKLTCFLGITPDGNPLSVNLNRVGHILIGGQQTSGKSNALNSILLSLVCLHFPYELKMALFDLNGSVFSAFEDISKTFLATFSSDAAIANDPMSAAMLLSGLDSELSTRKMLFSKASVSNISEYNGRFLTGDLNPKDGHNFLPFLIVAIDELTDISDVPNSQITLSNLLSDGAPLGIHVIAATRQRIRRTVLSEEMKKAFQGKISFRQETSLDSKSILDISEAANLYAIGDGLFLDNTSSTLSRLSSPCIDVDLKRLVFQFISSQSTSDEPYKLEITKTTRRITSYDDSEDSQIDGLLQQSAEVLLHSEKCNEASLQKAMEVSFNIAHRILLRMDELGITQKDGNVRILQITDISQLKSYL